MLINANQSRQMAYRHSMSMHTSMSFASQIPCHNMQPAPVSFGTLYGCTINFNGSFPAIQPSNTTSNITNFDLTETELNELISDF